MFQGKNNPIKHAEIDWSEDFEPFSLQFNDIYYSTDGGALESNYVFFEGNFLNERWNDCNKEFFTIAETGFGTGLNFLSTSLKFSEFRIKNKTGKLKKLRFVSFEKYPLKLSDFQKALKKWDQFGDLTKILFEKYPKAVDGQHIIDFDKLNIRLELWFGDVNDNLPIRNMTVHDVDAWYLDGFAPKSNPEMWNDNLFSNIASSCSDTATISTFTAASFVRHGLIEAGFLMRKRKGFGKKREMLVGNIKK